jgi:hypothetical protein
MFNLPYSDGKSAKMIMSSFASAMGGSETGLAIRNARFSWLDDLTFQTGSKSLRLDFDYRLCRHVLRSVFSSVVCQGRVRID